MRGAARLDLNDEGVLEAEEAPERTDAEASRRERARRALLAYFGGFTHSEIADLLGMPLGTVKGRMRLGLEKVRTNLGEQIS